MWHATLHRSKIVHLYVAMDFETPIYISKVQNIRLLRPFSHPSNEKLFNVLSRARPSDTTAETRRILEEIIQQCYPSQNIEPAPQRFKVALGTEHIQINERIMINITYIDGKPILKVIDGGTTLSSAKFLTNKCIQLILNTLLGCWANIYIGMLNRILVDQGTEFVDLFIRLAAET